MTSPRFKLATLAATAAALLCGATAAQAADYVTKAVDLGPQSGTQALTFSHVFADADPLQAGLQLALDQGAVTLASTDRFYDDYAFSIAPSSFSTLVATIDLAQLLQLSNLRVRLYSGDLSQTTTGAVASPALLAAWSPLFTATGSGTVQVIDPITLAAGHYVLEVRGNITGASGGAYVGAMNLSPVPEPQSYAMLLAGLGAVAFVIGRGQRRG